MSSSDLVFTDAGPVAPDSAAVKAAVAADWQAAFDNRLNTDDATPQGQLIVSETAVIQDKNAQLLHLAQQFDPAQAEGRFQDALGSIYFIERQAARPTTVQCVCRGRAGTVIPGADGSAAPARVADENGMEFICRTGGAIGADGAATLLFEASQSGAVSVPAHSVVKIMRAIPGWDQVDNPAPGIVGQSVETRRAFEERRRASVALNSRSMLASVYARIGDAAGVIDVLARQNRNSSPMTLQGVTLAPHSVYVSVLGGDDQAVAEALYNTVSGGCDYNGNTAVRYVDPVSGAVETIRFQRPSALDFKILVRLRTTASTPSDIGARVRANIAADFYGETYPYGDPVSVHRPGRVRLGETVYASRFYRPAMLAGAADLLSIAFADGSLDQAVPYDRYPSLNAGDITVEVAA